MKGRNLLMIPGPIEFEPEVMTALGAPTTSHLAPEFIEAFGEALSRLRHVFSCEDGQPFVLAGTGTLAMDSAAANMIEPGDQVLVVNTGYFGDRFAAILERYGAQVKNINAPVGGHPALEEVEKELQANAYKVMTITHVDTSTGVLTNVRELAALGRKYGVIVVVDGVCSVAGEELSMSAWGIDLALTASQKAVGVPPGLALLMAGPRAMAAFQSRKAPVMSYYADWSNWLPIMQAYEARRPSYFGTPAVNLIFALNVSLGHILNEGLEKRINRHIRISQASKAGINALGLSQVPLSPQIAANTMTAPRFPDGVNGPAFLSKVAQLGIILAGGLHPAIRTEYFRIGHMGAVSLADVLAVLSAVEISLTNCGYTLRPGIAVAAAQSAWGDHP